MEIHKPKAAHSWGEFAREIATIVCGILIALSLEEGVRAYHDRSVAEEARENVRAEAQQNLEFIQARLVHEGCVDDRIAALQTLLDKAGEGPIDHPPGAIGHPPTTPIFVERWQAAAASGRSSLFAAQEQAQLDGLYGLFVRYNAHEDREQAAWAHLRALENWKGPIGPAARISFAEALQEARYEAWDLHFAGTMAERMAQTLSIKPATGDASDTAPASICLPMTLTRAQAMQKLKEPFGEP